MSAVILRRELSLEVPKALVGAVQPYQTLGGPALTVAFTHAPSVLPFQYAPFYHAAVAPLYFDTLLHTLAEFAETPRAVAHSHVKQLHTPKADFWDSVGTLNCFYGSAQQRPSPVHPVMGAVELVRPSHRAESDVKLTLFDAAHQPVSTLLMSGPKSVAQESVDHTTNISGANGERKPLPPLAPQASFTAGANTGEEVGGDALASVVLGGAAVRGGLYGPIVPIGDGSGGYGQRALYTLSTTLSMAEEGGATAVPPWLLFDYVQRFFNALYTGGYLGSAATLSGDTTATGWRLASHHVVQTGDAVLGLPMEIVCAAPRVFPSYRIPPWRTQLGLPFNTGAGVPCVCCRCEVRQSGRMVSTGTYFFCCYEGE